MSSDKQLIDELRNKIKELEDRIAMQAVIGELQQGHTKDLENEIATMNIIAELKDSYQNEIAEKNKFIENRNQEIKGILENVNEGLFIIDSNLTFAPDTSKSFRSMIGLDDPHGRSVVELFLSRLDIVDDRRKGIEASLFSAFGEPEYAFILNSDHLPNKAKFSGIDSSQYTVMIDWIPLFDQDKLVNQILVSVKDITKIIKLQEKSKEKELYIDRILSVVRSSHGINAVLQDFNNLVDECKESCQNYRNIEDLEQIKQSLHTLKGNARTAGFKLIANMAHRLESELLKSSRTPAEDGNIIDALGEIKNEIDVISNIVGDLKLRDDSFYLSKNQIDEIFKLIPEGSSAKIQNIKKTIFENRYCTIERVVMEDIDSFHDLCKVLEKEKVRFEFGGSHIFFSDLYKYKIKSFLGHLIRNSLDHGIENPEVRIKKGKNTEGCISIMAVAFDKEISIEFKDDGAGLQLDRIVEKAKKLYGKDISNLSKQEKANYILKSDFSTSSSVSHVSGRGIGVSAVVGIVAKLGGSISIKVADKHDELGNLPFSFLIKMPKKIFAIS